MTLQTRCEALAQAAQPVTEEALRELDQRNLQRAAEAAKRMGPAYVLHPANRVPRLPPQATPDQMAHTRSIIARWGILAVPDIT